MSSEELRQNFLNFFKERGHTIVQPSSLLPADPSVLFTTAGMQQFKDYYLHQKSPYGPRAASVQKCLRTSDIDEVGDERHLTFFEMLGNFSFGDYFKKETIAWALEFLIENCKLKIDNLWITYFEGDDQIQPDHDSKQIWQELGIPQQRLHSFGRQDNFWGPTGKEGPCGPTSEIHYDLSGAPCDKGAACLPNCSCGRFIELWNLVFNQYYCDSKGDLAALSQNGVDTGMGLERLAMVVQNKKSIYETDLFEPLMRKITNSKFQTKVASQRIITDHIKAAVFIASEGIVPANVEQGYVLRRLLRRAIRYVKILEQPESIIIELAKTVGAMYQAFYPELTARQNTIIDAIQKEQEKFTATLERGLKHFARIAKQGAISGQDAFYLYESYGFPLELTQELAAEQGLAVDEPGFKAAVKRHQQISRAGAVAKFGGIGIEQIKDPQLRYLATKHHTATHLLHAALRAILGSEVKQMGSDVSPDRFRFDFSFQRKLTPEELRVIERLVNEKIKAGLEVTVAKMSCQQALASGAWAFFKEKYPEQVTVYTIGNFSKEICAGPHVKNTSELGQFKIVKEESVGAGVRRIRAAVK